MPDIEKFERNVFKKRNALSYLLAFSLKLMQARQVGLLLGTNRSYLKFLPPQKWDRGVMHKFDGKGFSGFLLKCFGTWIVRYKGLSPIRLYKDNQFGEREDSDGIISFVLRSYKEFYGKGIKVLIIHNLAAAPGFVPSDSEVLIQSYDGKTFQAVADLKINQAIVRQFKARNFVSAYVPDYGAIVFNTIDEMLLEKQGHQFVNESLLKQKLNMLISAIEMASLAHIGQARGRQAARMIWRKEKGLRKTALELKKKEKELDEQKKYLKAVGAVNKRQLNMEAVNITDGVYAFMDMVGSATLRKQFEPQDYFYILNLCHQITANNANKYGCRVDNFIGDSVFLQNASPFDADKNESTVGIEERIMRMILAISSTFNEIAQLKKGNHPMDPSGRVNRLISQMPTDICYRAGMEIGSAMIGPLGSQKRKIVTAIGKAVNTASRLESSGVKEWIHVSDRIMPILKEACVTENTRMLCGVIRQVADLKGNPMEQERFLKFYQSVINTQKTVIKECKNVSYKEFSKDISYIIRCLSETDAA